MRVTRMFAVALSASLSVTGAVVADAAAAVAAEPSAVTAPVVETYERPDVVSARVLARSSGRRVLATGLTSETSLTFVNPDGSLTDEVSAGPVRVRRAERWKPIDVTLVADGGRVRPMASSAEVSFSGGGDGALATVASPRGPVGLSWPGALPAPLLAENTATYANVLPGVDLVLTALPHGFEQSLVLRSRPASPPVFRLGLSAAGLVSRRLASGVVELVSGGEVVASVGAARMWDAHLDPVSRQPRRDMPVASAVMEAAQGRVLELRPDVAFLADPTTAYPVTVDPTVTLGRQRDTYVQQNGACQIVCVSA